VLEQISHYKILKKLGVGGMGEVYLAEDTKLTRKVALKILPAEVSGGRRHLNRFLQEARLAANLNHPHICTIYEIDAASEPPFLAMELVEGETLAEKASAGALDLHEILDIGSQIADALDEAHRNDIIHRDIKSSNVILNRRGQVKVLDFGLAKIISEEVSEQDVTRAKTEDGMLVGTVQYMSPEHALGKKLDGRTDLWSLGVLLYEMACGRLPFKAATQAGTFDEILHRQPVAPREINPDIPPELENIIFKLLEKDREFRYQTASDLLADLKRLRRSIGDITSDSHERVKASTGEMRAAANTETLTRSKIERRRGSGFWLRVAFAFLLTAFLGGVGYTAWNYLSSKTPKSFEGAVSTRQTNLGKVVDAVISPDGNYVVYVTDEGARQSLWIKQTATGSVVQIVAPSENVYQGLAISPDNVWVYFNVWDRKSVGEVFRIPALGGAPQKIVHDCMPSVSVSPDGKRLTYVRSDDRNKRYLVLTINADGTDEREIQSLPEAMAFSPLFAPDGKTIAFGMFGGKDSRFSQIIETPAEGGEMKTVFRNERNDFQPNRFVWLPDKSGFLITLNNSREFQSQIWRIDYGTGALQQITKDLNSYGALSITADGKSLLAVQQDFLLSVWVIPVDNPAQARRVTEGKTEGIGLNWTPDNRIVYASNVGGSAEIWIMNEDGTGKKQLTSDRVPKLSPCVSGDGKYIFHNITGNERGGAARMDIDGRNSKLLENKWNVGCASASPAVAYFATVGEEGHAALFSDTSEMTSPSQKLTEKGLQDFTLSPDGKSVAYITWEENKRTNVGEVLSLKDGSVKTFAFPTSAVQKYSESQFVLHWTADGKNLSFVNDENGFANIWLLPLNGEKPKRITNFNDNYIFSFAWSSDGKRLAVSRGTLTSDAIIFKQN
jgi:serine/threonine protein kinase/Tol biopolymer transport system component